MKNNIYEFLRSCVVHGVRKDELGFLLTNAMKYEDNEDEFFFLVYSFVIGHYFDRSSTVKKLLFQYWNQPENATYAELEKLGVKHVLNHGITSLGTTEKVVIMNNGMQYDYYSEDGIYGLKTERISIEKGNI